MIATAAIAMIPGAGEALDRMRTPEIVADAAQRGAATHVDVYSYEWDWMSLLERPLDEVRGSLGIPPGGTVLAGATWNPKSE